MVPTGGNCLPVLVGSRLSSRGAVSEKWILIAILHRNVVSDPLFTRGKMNQFLCPDEKMRTEAIVVEGDMVFFEKKSKRS